MIYSNIYIYIYISNYIHTHTLRPAKEHAAAGSHDARGRR